MDPAPDPVEFEFVAQNSFSRTEKIINFFKNFFSQTDRKPLLASQHAYTKGKSVEMARGIYKEVARASKLHNTNLHGYYRSL